MAHAHAARRVRAGPVSGARDGAAIRVAGPALPATVGALRARVQRFAEQHGAPAGDVALAVSEALTNAVVHAYSSHEHPGEVRAFAQRVDHTLIVVVEDDGDG